MSYLLKPLFDSSEFGETITGLVKAKIKEKPIKCVDPKDGEIQGLPESLEVENYDFHILSVDEFSVRVSFTQESVLTAFYKNSDGEEGNNHFDCKIEGHASVTFNENVLGAKEVSDVIDKSEIDLDIDTIKTY